MNCDDDVNKGLCSKEGIEGFPTIKFYQAGGRGVDTYEGAQTPKALYEFAVERLPSQVVNLRTLPQLEAFKTENVTRATSKCGAVLLTDKFETSPLYKALSTHFYPQIAFAEARASNQKLAEAVGVASFPTLVMVCHGQVQEYDGDLKLEPLETFFKKYTKKR